MQWDKIPFPPMDETNFTLLGKAINVRLKQTERVIVCVDIIVRMNVHVRI